MSVQSCLENRPTIVYPRHENALSVENTETESDWETLVSSFSHHTIFALDGVRLILAKVPRSSWTCVDDWQKAEEEMWKAGTNNSLEFCSLERWVAFDTNSYLPDNFAFLVWTNEMSKQWSTSKPKVGRSTRVLSRLLTMLWSVTAVTSVRFFQDESNTAVPNDALLKVLRALHGVKRKAGTMQVELQGFNFRTFTELTFLKALRRVALYDCKLARGDGSDRASTNMLPSSRPAGEGPGNQDEQDEPPRSAQSSPPPATASTGLSERITIHYEDSPSLGGWGLSTILVANQPALTHLEVRSFVGNPSSWRQLIETVRSCRTLQYFLVSIQGRGIGRGLQLDALQVLLTGRTWQDDPTDVLCDHRSTAIGGELTGSKHLASLRSLEMIDLQTAGGHAESKDGGYGSGTGSASRIAMKRNSTTIVAGLIGAHAELCRLNLHTSWLDRALYVKLIAPILDSRK